MIELIFDHDSLHGVGEWVDEATPCCMHVVTMCLYSAMNVACMLHVVTMNVACS